MRFTIEHLQSFWHASDDLDVVLLHYDELQADLKGQMRQLAAHLDIEVNRDLWPQLVEAASFQSMRARADTTVAAGREHWINPASFFSRGTSGQWRDLLDDANRDRYSERLRVLTSDDEFIRWLHRESID